MSLRRKQIRRCIKETNRKCLTVSDAWMINQMRRNPTDHPSLGLRKRKDRPKRPRLVFPDITLPEDAWRYLKVIYRSEAARQVCRWMRSHPGPQCQLSPEALLLGIILAADKNNRYHRTDVCSIINGLDATILYHLGLCDNKTFEPISYSTVQKQLLRFEQVPFTQLMREDMAERGLELESWTDESDGADPGLLWFNIDVLFATVTKKQLAKVKAGALDATAFETSGRTRDFRVQKAVDKAIREALKAGEEVPGDVMLGPDGKLIRCPYDPKARGSLRTASSETGFTQKFFTGYFATSFAVSRDYKWSGDPTKLHLREDLGPLLLAFSLAPATRDKGPIGRDVTAAMKQFLPQLHVLTADREFTEKRDSFVNPLHDLDIEVIMDYKQLFTENFDPVTLPNGERVYASCGDHFVWWMPEEFYGVPDDSLTEEEKHDWYERRAAYRYSSNGSLKNGKIQKLCPQCAGRIIYAEKTRMGKYRNAPHPDSALSFGSPLAAGYCCRGSVTLGGDELGHWQPIPWRTRAQSKLYRWGRSRIENTNGLVKEDGAISKRACRAPGTAPRNMAFLAMAVVNNVQFVEGDPDADPQPDDMPKAELSLYCVLPAFGNGTGDTDQGDHEEVSGALVASRAPP